MSHSIETHRLMLRYLTTEDVSKLYQMSREEGMRQWIPNQVYETKDEAEEVIHFLKGQYAPKEPDPKAAPYVLGVELKFTGELIGHVGLSAVDEGIEIGYAIEERYFGKGYATEAVDAMTAWALEDIKLPVVMGIVDSANTASCKVLEKVGYVLVEEKKRKAFGREGQYKVYKYARAEENSDDL